MANSRRNLQARIIRDVSLISFLMIIIFFQFMHCFEGHHVTTLGEITSNSGGHHVQVRLNKCEHCDQKNVYLSISRYIEK